MLLSFLLISKVIRSDISVFPCTSAHMHMGIPLCVLQSLYANKDLNTHTVSVFLHSPYAYGERSQFQYAFGDEDNPRMHTGMA